MEAVVRFVPSQRDCFCAWRTSRPMGSFCLLALVTAREQTVYVVANTVQFSPTDEVYIGAMFAAKQGLLDGEIVHVMFEGQVEALPVASRIAVAPETPDDWELLESNQDRLCHNFLSQCCCVWPRMRLPLWVDDMCLLLHVTAVSDARPEFAILREHSEVAVEPPGRAPTVARTAKVTPPAEATKAQPTPAVKVTTSSSFLSLFLSLADFVHFLWRGHTFSARRQMSALAQRWAAAFGVSADSQTMVGRLTCSGDMPTDWPLVFTSHSFCGFARARVMPSLCEKVASKKQKLEALSAEDFPEVVVAVRFSERCSEGLIITNQLVTKQLNARSSDCVVLFPLPIEASMPRSIRLSVSHDLKGVLPTLRKNFLSWLRVNFSEEQPLVLATGSKLLLEADQVEPISCDVTVNFSRAPAPPCALLSSQVISSGITRLIFDASPITPLQPTLPTEISPHPLTTPLPPEMLESTLLDAVRRALLEHQPMGAVVCGPSGSGRSTLVAQVATALGADSSLLAHCSWLSCRELRSKILDRFRREATAKMHEALWRRPSILVLDDIDVLLARGEAEHEDDSTPFLFASVLRSLFDEMSEAIASDPKQHQVSLIVTLEEPDCLSLLCASSATFSLWLNLPSVTEAALRRLQLLPDRDLFDLRSFTARLGRPLSGFPLAELKFLLEKEAVQPLPAREESHGGLSAVGGLQDTKLQLTRCVLWPRHFPDVFALCPLRPQRGLLLFGPSGCGKTRLARAVAAAAAVDTIVVRGPELLSKFIGASEANVRQIFRRARLAAPCLLFFDEFDALAPRRGHDSTGVTDRVVNQLLTELDGASAQLEGVFVMAASNRPELIDPALLRPGRLDQLLFCGLPDEEARREIAQLCASELDVELTAGDLQLLAGGSEGFTGADLRGLLLAARLAALRRQGAWDARQMWRTSGEGDAGLSVGSEARVLVTAADVKEAFRKVPGSFGVGRERERAAMEANFAAFRRCHGTQENPEEARVTLA